MTKTLMLILLLLCLSTVGYAQHSKPRRVKTEVRLSRNKPTVYITFERAGKREPLEAGESDEGIWLRLHNNTRWTITFPAFGVPETLGEVGMFYEVEAIRNIETYRDAPKSGESQRQEQAAQETPVGYRLGHVSSTVQLPPGDSIVFSVPREHLNKGLALHLSFSYEWQNQDDVFAGRDPRTYVYFYSSALPQTIQRNGK